MLANERARAPRRLSKPPKGVPTQELNDLAEYTWIGGKFEEHCQP